MFFFVSLTRVFSGLFWSAVRGWWTFQVRFKFGHELAPLSMVLFWGGGVIESWPNWTLLKTGEVVFPCWSKLGNSFPPIFCVVCFQEWCLRIMGIASGLGRGVFRRARIFTWVSHYFSKFLKGGCRFRVLKGLELGSVIGLCCSKFGNSITPIVSLCFPHKCLLWISQVCC